MPRGWRQHLGFDVASDLEHTFRLVWLALLISRMEKKGDESLIIKMALVHDIAETRTSDHSYVQKYTLQPTKNGQLTICLKRQCFQICARLCINTKSEIASKLR